jgi:hypothetical protein
MYCASLPPPRPSCASYLIDERKTPQEKLCGNAEKRPVSNQRFTGRKTEDFRSHTTGKIQTKGPKQEDLKLARLQIVHAVKSKTFAELAVCHFTPLAVGTFEGSACLVSRSAAEL